MIEVLHEHGLGKSYHLARVHAAHSPDSCGTAGKSVDTMPVQPSRRVSLPLLNQGNKLLSRPDFAKTELELLQGEPERIQSMLRKLKPRSGHYCGATSGALHLIDPKGDISRCWMSAGVPSQSIGNVLIDSPEPEVRFLQAQVDARWSNYSPFAFAACPTCKVLPLCAGGCSHPRLFAGDLTPPCEAIKHQIQQCVHEVGSRLRVPGRP
jgi:uncharacterized protein